MKYYGTTDMLECHLPFNFQLILAKWLAPGVRKMVDDYEAVLPGMPGPTGCSATTTSTGSPPGSDPHRRASANMLLLTLRGTPTSYYGDELGMEDVAIPPEKIQDPPAVNQPEIAHIVGATRSGLPCNGTIPPMPGSRPRRWRIYGSPSPQITKK